MSFDRIHSMAALVATLAFTAMLTLPCLCATASAQMENESESSCPCSEDDHNTEHEDCCCGCAAVSPSDDHTDATPSGGAVFVSYDEDSLETPTSWWSPDLVVTLWLVNRLAEFDVVHPPIEADPLVLKPDRSDTYLQNSTFLI